MPVFDRFNSFSLLLYLKCEPPSPTFQDRLSSPRPSPLLQFSRLRSCCPHRFVRYKYAPRLPVPALPFSLTLTWDPSSLTSVKAQVPYAAKPARPVLCSPSPTPLPLSSAPPQSHQKTVSDDPPLNLDGVPNLVSRTPKSWFPSRSPRPQYTPPADFFPLHSSPLQVITQTVAWLSPISPPCSVTHFKRIPVFSIYSFLVVVRSPSSYLFLIFFFFVTALPPFYSLMESARRLVRSIFGLAGPQYCPPRKPMSRSLRFFFSQAVTFKV